MSMGESLRDLGKTWMVRRNIVWSVVVKVNASTSSSKAMKTESPPRWWYQQKDERETPPTIRRYKP